MALVLGRGATAVRTAVADYLSGVVPQVVSQARTDWSLDEYQLPLPFAYDAYEPYALDRWPLLGVNVAQAGGGQGKRLVRCPHRSGLVPVVCHG